MLALKASEIDNVATLFTVTKKGDVLKVTDPSGTVQNITANSDIPYGHKIALEAIKVGESIMKYGEEIGIATKDIVEGDYVHVHNLDSNRARGDLQKEAIKNE